MIIYSEIKNGSQSLYVKTLLDSSGKVTQKRTIRMPLYHIDIENFTYYILYDETMHPNGHFFKYMNHSLRNTPYNTRHKHATALRLLFCFLSLSNLDINEIDSHNLSELITFLRGIDINPKSYSMQTSRSGDTVNGYLSVYRNYFTMNSISCPPLFRSHIYQDHNKYDNNITTSTSNIVPRYISPEEFRLIYNLSIQKKDRLAKIILYLLYVYGLRLGEVLGLTTEDIAEIQTKKGLVPVLILRNRISDKKFQYAKNLPHAISPKDYKSKDYIDSYSLPKARIPISYQIYEEILDYIETFHSIAINNYPKNYAKGIADIVSNRNRPDTNHYVFLSRYGGILTDQTWNNSLRNYFIEARIPLDYDVRKNNLSHRFRHGFAMFHAKYSKHPLGPVELRDVMRHKSINSTMIYYNPTLEDEYEIKTEFQKEFISMIPELKDELE